MKRQTFMDKVVADESLSVFNEIESAIHFWHRSSSPKPLYEWLGMTRDEYSSYVENESSLIRIVQLRRSEL